MPLAGAMLGLDGLEVAQVNGGLPCQSCLQQHADHRTDGTCEQFEIAAEGAEYVEDCAGDAGPDWHKSPGRLGVVAQERRQ